MVHVLADGSKVEAVAGLVVPRTGATAAAYALLLNDERRRS